MPRPPRDPVESDLDEPTEPLEAGDDDPTSLASRLTPTDWARLGAAITQFAAATRGRGVEYAEEGRVTALRVTDGAFEGTVRGTVPYRVIWSRRPTTWTSRCTCPVEIACKHAYALAWEMMSRAGHAAAVFPASRAQAPRTARGRASLEEIRTSHPTWRFESAVMQLVRDAGFELNTFQLPMAQLAGEPDPDMRCWRLARAIADLTGGAVPSGLESYLSRTDLAARHAQAEQAALAAELSAWAGRLKTVPQRRLRVLVSLTATADGRAQVTIEPRLTTPRLDDAPRNEHQLANLRSEAHRTPGLLAPPEIVLLDWLVDRQAGGAVFGRRPPLHGSGLGSFLELVADTPLATWSNDLDATLAARAGVQSGATIRRSLTPARLVPDCIGEGDDTRLTLRFVWTGGRRRAVEEVVHVERPESHATQGSWVLADGVFSPVTDEPPPSLVRRFRESGGLPLTPAQRLPLLRDLGRGFPHLLDTVRKHTRVHDLVAAFVVELHDDTWLQLRLLAVPPGWLPGERPLGAMFEDLPDGGWTRRASFDAGAATGSIDGSAPTPVSPQPTIAPDDVTDVWSEGPRPDAAEPAVAWLEGTRALPGTSPPSTWTAYPPSPANEHGWWLLLSPQRLELLAEAWEQRPRGAAFYGTERARRLLGRSAVGPRLKLGATAGTAGPGTGIDWFAISAEWATEGLALSEQDLEALRTARTRFVKLSGGWMDRQRAAQHDETATLLADLGIEPGTEPTRVTVWQLAGAKRATLDALERLSGDADTSAALEAMRTRIAGFDGLPRIALPPTVEATLRPYQHDGLDFLAWTAGLGLGAVLADDMGLGKTLQTLAWLAHLRATESGPVLVVCPASVVHNWARETTKFLPSWRVLLLTSGAERHALRSEIAQYDLVVTNYALLRRDAAHWKELPLLAAIFDEAQQVKNPDAAVTQAARQIDARHRLALTGTPLENRALDLWSIMSVVNPGYLGGRTEFTGRYDRPDAAPHRRALLAARMRPVLLRRLKREVAQDLPERIEERLDCELSPAQRKLYLAELRRSRRLVDELAGEAGGLAKNRIQILAALTRLRQICCHPALVGGNPDEASGKFDAFFELLEPLLAEGHKVLVFSQFVACLRLLRAEMVTRRLPHHLLTGATTKREEVVRAFTDDPTASVFLISLRAGGTGLNLTAASYVVLFDPWWNPAVEAQAIDRTHRIGQDRTVVAYRLVTRETIEEKILALQEQKASLVRDVLGEGGFGRALTRDDLTFLFADDE